MVSLLGANVHRARRNNKIFYKGRYVKYPVRKWPVRSGAAGSFRVPVPLHSRTTTRRPDQFQGVDLPPLRQGPRRKIPDPLQRENLERPGRGVGPGMGGRPRPQAACGGRDQGRGRSRDRRLHAPALLPLPAARRHRIASARHGRAACTTSCRISPSNAFGRKAAAGASATAVKLAATTRWSARFRFRSWRPRCEGTPQEILPRSTRCATTRWSPSRSAWIRRALPDYTAIYVPDPEVRFHRLSFPAVFSPHNAPAGQSIIQAEITTNPGDGTHEMSRRRAAGGRDQRYARRWTWCARSEVCYSRVLRTKYGYVVQNDDCRRYLKPGQSLFRADRHPAVRPRRGI